MRSYLYGPTFYLLSVARARHMMEMHSAPEEPQDVKRKNSYGGQRRSVGKEATSSTSAGQTYNQKVRRLSSRRITHNDKRFICFVTLCSFFIHDHRYLSFVSQVQQLIDLVLTCKRSAETEVRREEAAAASAGGSTMTPGRKRRLEQEMAERTLKFLKASQEPWKHSRSTFNFYF